MVVSERSSNSPILVILGTLGSFIGKVEREREREREREGEREREKKRERERALPKAGFLSRLCVIFLSFGRLYSNESSLVACRNPG
jgi:hypothetical protein